jgi:hypothetical protein
MGLSGWVAGRILHRWKVAILCRSLQLQTPSAADNQDAKNDADVLPLGDGKVLAVLTGLHGELRAVMILHSFY